MSKEEKKVVKLTYSEVNALSILLAAVAIRRDPTVEISERDNASVSKLQKHFEESYPKEIAAGGNYAVSLLEGDSDKAKNLATGILVLHSDLDITDQDNQKASHNLNVLNEIYSGNRTVADEVTQFGSAIRQYKRSPLFKKDLEKGVKAQQSEIRKITADAKATEGGDASIGKTSGTNKGADALAGKTTTVTNKSDSKTSGKVVVNAAEKNTPESQKLKADGNTDVVQSDVQGAEDVFTGATTSNQPSAVEGKNKITSDVSTDSGKQEDTTEHK